MNALAITLQGIGFAATLVAVQGFSNDEVQVVAPTPIVVSSASVVTQRTSKSYSWISKPEKLKVSAAAKIRPYYTNVAIGKITPTGLATAKQPTVFYRSTPASLVAFGQATATAPSTSCTSKVGQVVAYGEHGLSDQAILAMLLSLMVEARLV